MLPAQPSALPGAGGPGTGPPSADRPDRHQRLHAELVELLRQATGEDDEWSAGVGPTTRLDGDLFLDSIELAALSGLMVRRYGPTADLAAYVAGLDLDGLIALTVGDVADFVIRVGA